MTRITDVARRHLNKVAEDVCYDTEKRDLAETVLRYESQLDALKRIRARLTTLSLAANLPQAVWSELCHLDSEMSVALSTLSKEPTDDAG